MSPMCKGIHRSPSALIFGVNSAKTEGRRVPALEERNLELMAESVPNRQKRFLVRTFYLFTPLSAAKIADLFERYQEMGRQLELSGALILSPEGLNATVAGSPEATDDFFHALQTEFPSLVKQDSSSHFHPFKRWRVLRRDTLVQGRDPKLCPDKNHTGQKSPEEWDEVRRMVAEGRAQMVDVRNAYEIQIGTFPEALDPGTSSFKEFSEFLDREVGESLDPDLPTAIFCTGGIRCEKARIDLERRGFNRVWQLKGGILNYLKEKPEVGFEGECFVFDLRIAVDHSLSPTTTYKCCPVCGGATPIDGKQHQCTRKEV